MSDAKITSPPRPSKNIRPGAQNKIWLLKKDIHSSNYKPLSVERVCILYCPRFLMFMQNRFFGSCHVYTMHYTSMPQTFFPRQRHFHYSIKTQIFLKRKIPFDHKPHQTSPLKQIQAQGFLQRFYGPIVPNLTLIRYR